MKQVDVGKTYRLNKDIATEDGGIILTQGTEVSVTTIYQVAEGEFFCLVLPEDGENLKLYAVSPSSLTNDTLN